MFAQYLVFFVLSTLTLTLANDDPSLHQFRGHILKKDGKYEIITELEKFYKEPDNNVNDILATGFWDQTYNKTGWSVLEIKTSSNQTNIEQVYSAGLLEGQFTQELTGMQWQNSIADICANNTQFCKYLKQFFEIQLDWMYTQIDNYPDDEYWHQVNLLLIQLNGLIDGNQNTPRGPRKELDDPLGFFLFQVVESIGDLANRFNSSNVEQRDSCSALIKILPNNADIFVSHADWSHYKTMLKVIKRYTMPLKRSSAADSTIIPGSDTIFSSYPGTLHSIDDFYMTRPGNLTIIETTIDNNNNNLLHNIIPISVPEWIRVVVANRLANSGKEWIDKFFIHNDGTYNNEWMITDFKLFTPGQPPKPGFLMIAEQLVTESKFKDMTEILINNTYWASYNNIYFPDFRILSGEDDMVRQKGPALYSWQNSSRANIFRRDYVKVVDLQSMIHIMRYNNFTMEPFSRCDDCNPKYSAELTIAARCDLNLVNGTYPDPPLGHRPHGATDAKITNYEMMQNFTLVAIAGPTAQDQPAFVWSLSDFNNLSHVGHPDEWKFEPFTPIWMLS